MSEFALRETVVLAFAVLLLAAAVWDALSYRIPNALCLSLLAAYPLYLGSAPLAALDDGLLAFALVGAVGMIAFLRGWMGGGDVKLLSVVALWSGTALLPAVLFITAISGGLLALLMKTPLRLLMGQMRTWPDGAVAGQGEVHLPYGIAIACGGWFLAWCLLGAGA